MPIWPWTRYGSCRDKAVNRINGIPYCSRHARMAKKAGGKSAAQKDRPGKAATTRLRNQGLR